MQQEQREQGLQGDNQALLLAVQLSTVGFNLGAGQACPGAPPGAGLLASRRQLSATAGDLTGTVPASSGGVEAASRLASLAGKLSQGPAQRGGMRTARRPSLHHILPPTHPPTHRQRVIEGLHGGLGRRGAGGHRHKHARAWEQGRMCLVWGSRHASAAGRRARVFPPALQGNHTSGRESGPAHAPAICMEVAGGGVAAAASRSACASTSCGRCLRSCVGRGREVVRNRRPRQESGAGASSPLGASPPSRLPSLPPTSHPCHLLSPSLHTSTHHPPGRSG